ncbi:MAG: CBS domain-containing protein [Nitrospirae bacterium]|nr:CBS domain-containing protein [Nitrospirota bacterium]
MGMMTVGDMMSRDPVSVPPSCPLREAAQLMRRLRIRSLLVRDDSGFIGIMTGTDLANQVLSDEPIDGKTVSQIMTPHLLTIDLDEPLRVANEMMAAHHVRHLVVVEDGQPIGIISARDLLVPEEDVPGSIPFWPNHLLKEVVAALLTIALIVALAVLSPAPMLNQADPFTTPAHIKPEWYFLAAYQFLKFAEVFTPLGEWAPKLLGVGIMGVVVLILVFFPFIDRNRDRAPRRRPFAILFGIVCTLAFIGFTVWGHFS